MSTAAPAPPPPPPPPPMPGTSGALPMPNWRDLYPSQPPSRPKEHPPSKEEIEKQQYAHLPDKLINAMNKDKKPFTYTPSGVSSEKGVLDLSEIRSPRMKKRLLANLHAGEEEANDDQTPTPTSDQIATTQTQKSPNVQPYATSPFVLPPIPGDATQKLRTTTESANNNNSNNIKKEVHFAPSPIPILSCDDNELMNKLAARKQDVESRATIVTNNPVSEDSVDGTEIRPQEQTQTQPKPFESDVNQLCLNAAEAVRTARGIANGLNNNNNNNNYTNYSLTNDYNKINDLSDSFNKQLRFDQPDSNSNYLRQPQQQQTPTNLNTDVLKHVLDSGLQDEIDKFEEVGAKMETPSPNPPPNNYFRPVNHRAMAQRQPLSAIPQNSMDGRTSCPPNPTPYDNNSQSNGYINNFRCVSPFVNGYQCGNSKPRPFRRSSINDTTAFNPPMQSFQSPSSSSNERIIPIKMSNGYSASLPRKLKLGQGPKFYDNPEQGREYLQQAGMYSQLPPKQPLDSPTQSKMYFGLNSRQQPSQQKPLFESNNARSYVDQETNREYLQQAGMFSQLPPKQPFDSSTQSRMNFGSNPVQQPQPQQRPLFESNNAKSYVDPETNREYLQQAGMYSQLPPPPSQPTLSTFKTRQSSLPPTNGNNDDDPESPKINPWKQMARMNGNNRRLSMTELRRLPPSERPHESVPLKYTGSHIPSRSFRILQLMTGEDVPNQFVREDENDSRTQPRQERPQQAPPPPPPRSDSYRPASQQSFRPPATQYQYYQSQQQQPQYQQQQHQQYQQQQHPAFIKRPESATPMYGNYYQPNHSHHYHAPLNRHNSIGSSVYAYSSHGTDF